MKKVYGLLGMAAIAAMCALPTFAQPVQLSDAQMTATKGASASYLNIQAIVLVNDGGSTVVVNNVYGNHNYVNETILVSTICITHGYNR